MLPYDAMKRMTWEQVKAINGLLGDNEPGGLYLNVLSGVVTVFIGSALFTIGECGNVFIGHESTHIGEQIAAAQTMAHRICDLSVELDKMVSDLRRFTIEC